MSLLSLLYSPCIQRDREDFRPIMEYRWFESRISITSNKGKILAGCSIEEIYRVSQIIVRDVFLDSPLIQMGNSSVGKITDLPRDAFDCIYIARNHTFGKTLLIFAKT